MMDQSMDVDSATSQKSTCVSPLQFLLEVKNFIRASHSTEYNLIFTKDGFKPVTHHKWDLENNIPPETLWKCFDQVGMLKKVKKYMKLIMELFIMRFDKDKEDNEKLIEWHNIFRQLGDCIFIFCSKEEYGKELIPVIKSFADITLKKLRKVDMKDYHNEVFVHNFLQSILKQFFGYKYLTDSILEEIIKNSHDVVEAIRGGEKSCLSMEIVNNIECLNRYLNIAEITDRKKMRAIDSEILRNYKILLMEFLKIEVAPKYFSIRVENVLNLMKY